MPFCKGYGQLQLNVKEGCLTRETFHLIARE